MHKKLCVCVCLSKVCLTCLIVWLLVFFSTSDSNALPRCSEISEINLVITMLITNEKEAKTTKISHWKMYETLILLHGQISCLSQMTHKDKDRSQRRIWLSFKEIKLFDFSARTWQPLPPMLIPIYLIPKKILLLPMQVWQASLPEYQHEKGLPDSGCECRIFWEECGWCHFCVTSVSNKKKKCNTRNS